MSTPDVSIVLISFNDAARLPRAIDAALAQTLRGIEVIVVDDCSTDDTEQLVRERMQSDDRLRYLRLEQNSGGCSTPRNTGIAQARGTWVMFCDSDDELDMHAAKGLLLAVEEAGADLGCGVVDRVDVRTGKVVRWRAELHAPAVLDGIGERPELIADTVSVNKIYRRDWLLERGITFPEGLLYEDQLFTMRAYAEAGRIAVLDQSVYRWHVEKAAEELSITQRRHEVRNVRDRIAVNRLIDDYLQQTGRDDLVPAKQAKFLRHEAYLYLGVVLDADDETAEAIMAELAPYVATADLSLAAELRPPLRIALYHLLLGDREGVRDAMKAVRWSAVLPTRIRTEAGRDLWACEHLDGGPDVQGLGTHWWLDITAFHPSLAPVTDQRHCHEVSVLHAHGSQLDVTGRTVDAYGVLGRVDRGWLALTVRERMAARLPLRLQLDAHGVAHWSASGRLRQERGELLQPPDSGQLSIVLELDDGRRSVMPVRARHGVNVTLDEPHARLRSGDRGIVGFTALPPRRGPALLRRRADQRLQRVSGRAASMLPAGDLVLFMSEGAVRCDGAPLALSAWLQAAHPEVQQAWALRRAGDPVPAWATAVRAGSARHRWLAARARWWITDEVAMNVAGAGLRPGSRTRHLAMVGPSIRRVGSDQRDWPLLPASRRRAPWWVASADLVAAASPFVRDVIVPALGYDGPVVVGAALQEAIAHRAGARRDLDLPDDRPAVLWAWTGQAPSVEQVALALGGSMQLLLHGPGGAVPAAVRAWARDVTGRVPSDALVAACDAVVTDASPLAALAARAGRPVVIHAPDVRDLVSRGPGLYLDLPAAAPGPVVSDHRDVVEMLRALVASTSAVPDEYRAAHDAFGLLAADGLDGERARIWAALTEGAS